MREQGAVLILRLTRIREDLFESLRRTDQESRFNYVALGGFRRIPRLLFLYAEIIIVSTSGLGLILRALLSATRAREEELRSPKIARYLRLVIGLFISEDDADALLGDMEEQYKDDYEMGRIGALYKYVGRALCSLAPLCWDQVSKWLRHLAR